MTARIALIMAVGLLLSACNQSYECNVQDSKELERVFYKCLAYSKNSQNVEYNDSAEVIDECRRTAYLITPKEDGRSLQYGGKCEPLERSK